MRKQPVAYEIWLNLIRHESLSVELMTTFQIWYLRLVLSAELIRNFMLITLKTHILRKKLADFVKWSMYMTVLILFVDERTGEWILEVYSIYSHQLMYCFCQSESIDVQHLGYIKATVDAQGEYLRKTGSGFCHNWGQARLTWLLYKAWFTLSGSFYLAPRCRAFRSSCTWSILSVCTHLWFLYSVECPACNLLLKRVPHIFFVFIQDLPMFTCCLRKETTASFR